MRGRGQGAGGRGQGAGGRGQGEAWKRLNFNGFIFCLCPNHLGDRLAAVRGRSALAAALALSALAAVRGRSVFGIGGIIDGYRHGGARE